MKLTKSQKLFIRAGRILEAYRHDLKMSKHNALTKMVIEPQLQLAKQLLEEVLCKACLEYRKEMEK